MFGFGFFRCLGSGSYVGESESTVTFTEYIITNKQRYSTVGVFIYIKCVLVQHCSWLGNGQLLRTWQLLDTGI